jgi:hypothetical protein
MLKVIKQHSLKIHTLVKSAELGGQTDL